MSVNVVHSASVVVMFQSREFGPPCVGPPCVELHLVINDIVHRKDSIQSTVKIATGVGDCKRMVVLPN